MVLEQKGVGGIFLRKMMNRQECIGRVMTERQKEIYMVIEEWWKKFGFGPSIDDIMFITGDKSRANVHRMIKRLCESGACKRVPNRDRSVRPSWIKFKNI